MLALLGELQGVAAVCAKVCVQHLREFHEGILSPYKDSEACSGNEAVDDSVALEAMYEGLGNAGAGKITPCWQHGFGEFPPMGVPSQRPARCGNPFAERCSPKAEGFTRIFIGSEAEIAAGPMETNLASAGKWQPLPKHDSHSDGPRATKDRVRLRMQPRASVNSAGTTMVAMLRRRKSSSPRRSRQSLLTHPLRRSSSPCLSRQSLSTQSLRRPASRMRKTISCFPIGDSTIEDDAISLRDTDLVLWLPFDNISDNSLVEAVSGMPGEFLGLEQQAQAVSCYGRTGINFTGASLLRLARPIELGGNWTISFWMLSPMTREEHGQEWRYLLDGPASCRPVLLHHDLLGGAGARPSSSHTRDLRIRPGWTACGPLGNHSLAGFTRFRFSTLPQGWHHVAVVGTAKDTSYFVDGEPVGELQKPLQGVINGVGNKSHQQHALRTCSWGALSDLRIFSMAANAEQIRCLLRKGTQAMEAATTTTTIAV